MKARGFTLLELLVVIVITGILASMLTVFLRPAIDSYLDTKRRANLTDMADTALRRMGQDIRTAVPNSLRVFGGSCFQLVPTIGGGRYRMERDTSFASPIGSAWLDLTQPLPTGPGASLSFDVFNRLAEAPAVNDWVVIYNQNPNDVYTGANRAQILGAFTPPPPPSGAAAGAHRIFIQPVAFPSGYDGGRFVLVRNAVQTVVYNYVPATRTLFRGNVPFSNNLTAVQCGAANQVVATSVDAAVFVYNPNQGATQQSGYIQMQLTLTDHGETISLAHGVHVENAP